MVSPSVLQLANPLQTRGCRGASSGLRGLPWETHAPSVCCEVGSGTLASERLGAGTRPWRVFQRVAAHCAPVRESSDAISGRDQRSEPHGRRRRGLNRLEHVTSEQVFSAVYAERLQAVFCCFWAPGKRPFVRPLTIMRRIGGILGLHVPSGDEVFPFGAPLIDLRASAHTQLQADGTVSLHMGLRVHSTHRVMPCSMYCTPLVTGHPMLQGGAVHVRYSRGIRMEAGVMRALHDFLTCP
jgi:hypothetical protein